MTTNETSHTPEPWEIEELQGLHEYSIVKPGKWIVATTEGRESRDKANAARIVACVNACAGIADPSAIPGLLRAAKVAKEDLGKYCCIGFGDALHFSFTQLLAAIAKVEGKPPNA